jgi:hypothetical protein
MRRPRFEGAAAMGLRTTAKGHPSGRGMEAVGYLDDVCSGLQDAVKCKQIDH